MSVSMGFFRRFLLQTLPYRQVYVCQMGMHELFWTCFELSPENTGNQCSVFKIVYYFHPLISKPAAGFGELASAGYVYSR